MPKSSFVLFLQAVTWALAWVESASACDCREWVTPQVAFERADRVFVGKVVALSPGADYGVLAVTIDASNRLKGRGSAPEKVKTSASDCGVSVEAGKTYLFAVPKDNFVSRCSGFARVSDGSQEYEALLKQFSKSSSKE